MSGNSSVVYPKSQTSPYIFTGILLLIILIITILLTFAHIITFSFSPTAARIVTVKNSSNTILTVTVTYIGKITNVSGNQFTITNNSDSTTLTPNPLTQFVQSPGSRLQTLIPSQDLHVGNYVEVITTTTKAVTGEVLYVYNLTPSSFQNLNNSR